MNVLFDLRAHRPGTPKRDVNARKERGLPIDSTNPAAATLDQKILFGHRGRSPLTFQPFGILQMDK
jgi:hypothetical protein